MYQVAISLASGAEQEPMSTDESTPTETSRLVGGKGEQTRRGEGTKVCSIIKWVLCAGVGWTLIGSITVLIGSKFFQHSSWGTKSYEIEYLPYFDDFQPTNANITAVNVAFIGNGMQYVNDLPRFMETLSEGNITQNSCFRTGSSLKTIAIHGNDMSAYWNTPAARINGTDVYDFGACTVKQLMLGRDDHLERLARKGHYKHDPFIGNPCIEFPEYLDYLNKYYAKNKPRWDFVVLNDNSRNPSKKMHRAKGLKALGDVYVPLLQETGAIPVLLDTHAYSGSKGRTIDVPTFTSITYEGYEQYASYLESELPPWQKPRIAPVGIVFLTVWEEDQALWRLLFESDLLHNSPLGTFLQGCVIHYTVLGRMPAKKDVLRDDMSELWWNARMMQHTGDAPESYPSRANAEYVYNIAERVLQNKHLPKALFIRKDGDAKQEDMTENSTRIYEHAE
jgi:hypothetical protein